jgi:antitoxin VapB
MSLNIKNGETQELARRLAAATGESVTRAVTVAVAERLDRVQREEADAIAARAERMRAISREDAGRWEPPYRDTAHGDLLYDSQGLPA